KAQLPGAVAEPDQIGYGDQPTPGNSAPRRRLDQEYPTLAETGRRRGREEVVEDRRGRGADRRNTRRQQLERRLRGEAPEVNIPDRDDHHPRRWIAVAGPGPRDGMTEGPLQGDREPRRGPIEPALRRDQLDRRQRVRRWRALGQAGMGEECREVAGEDARRRWRGVAPIDRQPGGTPQRDEAGAGIGLDPPKDWLTHGRHPVEPPATGRSELISAPALDGLPPPALAGAIDRVDHLHVLDGVVEAELRWLARADRLGEQVALDAVLIAGGHALLAGRSAAELAAVVEEQPARRIVGSIERYQDLDAAGGTADLHA